MDTEDTTNDRRFSAGDIAAVVVVAGAVTVSCIALAKLSGVVTDRAVDAVVNTMTHSRTKKHAKVKSK